MEGNDWYNPTGYTDYRNHYRGDEREIDQDVFRGAYRFDNESRDRNESTYDGFDRRNQQRDYSGSYNRRSDYNSPDQRYYENETRNRNQNWSRNRDNDEYQRGNYSNRNEQRNWRDNDNKRQYRSTGIGSNFDGNYSPDPYYSRGADENYGNMAGSLSYGYDGDYNADWDEGNRHYNPLTGERHSYHGNYTSRHPNRENTREGRSFDRNRGHDYDPY